MNNLVAVVNSVLADVPLKYRSAVYKGIKYAGALAFVVLLVILNDSTLGFETPGNIEKIATAAVAFFASLGLAFGGSLADANKEKAPGESLSYDAAGSDEDDFHV